MKYKRYKIYGHDGAGEYQEWHITAINYADALYWLKNKTGMPIDYITKQFRCQRIY